jgi:hypothetical protein
VLGILEAGRCAGAQHQDKVTFQEPHLSLWARLSLLLHCSLSTQTARTADTVSAAVGLKCGPPSKRHVSVFDATQNVDRCQDLLYVSSFHLTTNSTGPATTHNPNSLPP